jgi:catechol 2,3-dioxygenase-like lactoylglutathione lyase family enzyme
MRTLLGTTIHVGLPASIVREGARAMSIGHAHHIAMRSPNYEATKRFYTETLGFPIVGKFEGRNVVFIDIGGTTIELGQGDAQAEEPPKSGLMHLAFEVDDVDATYEELRAKGVEFTIEPRSPFGDLRIAFFRDPDGNSLELFKSPTYTWK